MNVSAELQNRLHLFIAHVLRLRRHERQRARHLRLTASSLPHIVTAQNRDQPIDLSKIRPNFAASQLNQFVADRANRLVQRQNALLRVPELRETDLEATREREREFVKQNRHGLAVEKLDVATKSERKTEERTERA